MHTYLFFIQASQTRLGGGGKDAARKDKEGTQHRQGRHLSDGREARQHRQGCRRSLVLPLQEQAAMNRPHNGSEGWQLTRVCSVKHQKQLSGRQGSWSEKHRGKIRTAPVAPKDRIWTALLKSPGNRAFWNAYLQNGFTQEPAPRR
jgi:hypothetical protein